MYDAEYIGDIITNCPVSGFQPNPDGVIEIPELGEYINIRCTDIIESAPKVRDEILEAKFIHEYGLSRENPEITGQSMNSAIVVKCGLVSALIKTTFSSHACAMWRLPRRVSPPVEL